MEASVGIRSLYRYAGPLHRETPTADRKVVSSRCEPSVIRGIGGPGSEGTFRVKQTTLGRRRIRTRDASEASSRDDL